jgi:transposase
MPTAVDQVWPGKARVFDRRFVQLCSHYLVEPVACTPGSGWEKGQVERQVKSIREWLHPMLFITQCFSRIETRSL